MDNILVIFAVIWVVGRLFSALGKKNQRGVSEKQRQAVEEQRRRREAYEAAQRERLTQQQKRPSVWQQEKAPWQVREPQDWLLMDEPQREQPTQPVREAAASPLHHIDAVEEARCAEANRLKQEQRQAAKPAPLAARPTAQKPKAATKTKAASAPPAAERRLPQRVALVQGIIMAEILGPPRAKKHQIRNF